MMSNLEFSPEILESRRMLAGDVRVVVNGSDLTITGTGESDSIRIFGENNQIRVAAGFGSATTVNGEAEFSTGVSVMGKLKVRMKGGDDEVVLSNLIANESARINMGSAFSGDLVYFGVGFANFSTVRVKTGSRADAVVLDGPTIDGDLKINTAGGNDTVTFTNNAKMGGGKLSINTGGGNDDVEVRSWFVGAGSVVAMNGGGGSDSLQIPADDLFNPDISFKSFEELGAAP
jgi:hypothetical protein